MNTSEVFLEAFGRITELVHKSVDGLGIEGLAFRPEPGANSIAWLVWHLTRIQDEHLSDISGIDQAWISDGWHGRFGMEADPGNTGRGHGPKEVAAIPPDGNALVAHHEAVAERTRTYLANVTDSELDRIIDRSYDPPVTVGVRLVSVISDNIQHAGQARYLRGIVERLGQTGD
ncbi:MAG: mycothiol transferase [Acidimicrobiia bacterium]